MEEINKFEDTNWKQAAIAIFVLLLVNLDPHYYSDWCMLFLIGFVGDQL